MSSAAAAVTLLMFVFFRDSKCECKCESMLQMVQETASSSWTETAQAEMIDEANHAGTDAAFPPMPVACCRNARVAAGTLAFTFGGNQCAG